MSSEAAGSLQPRRDSLSCLSSPASQQPPSLQQPTARLSRYSFHHSLQLSHLERLLSHHRLLAKLQGPRLLLLKLANVAQLTEPQRTVALEAEIEGIRQSMQLVDKVMVAIEGQRSRLEKTVTKLEQQRSCRAQNDDTSCTLNLSLNDDASDASDEDYDGSAAEDEAGNAEANAELAIASTLDFQTSTLHSQLSLLSTQSSRLWCRRARLQAHWAYIEALSAQEGVAVKRLIEALTKCTLEVESAEGKLQDEIIMLVVLRGQTEL
ncbi:hypothetical protein BCR35DRAFT_305538 [Leucosporidium creatinivorum]|uniref:Uncharacterized protein n=1 Tax=Leucosporidium creatinivorum TaxID=106004 RepID=A0A1Y2F030_9BASI|nr:hypothetical protein BCR35DRAFT_305538 [Leucosporidium creatinivorum]